MIKNNIKTVIKVENLGKKYFIGLSTKSRTIKELLTNFSFKKLFKKDETEEAFWALKNINFEVKEKEIFGLIGANGSGKSTLLKILSQITPPTEGKITIHGHIASLLEVGTGFHPDLTGRENIFLNGAILGMSKAQVTKKFDDIVEFSEIGKFLDTPVKHYSSGMYVRLAFSVAVHLDSEILIMDEVLAVGDAQFQKKCLNKIKLISSQRTVLFVSHDVTAVKKLCDRAMLLKDGEVKMVDKADKVVDFYVSSVVN
jgi:lipopolysaccharide transport system ATP-binding protein